MIALSKLAAAILGTSTLANGFAVSPTAPASLQVSVAAGEIYMLANIDGTAYSSLAADTTHSILKQGIVLDATLLTCAAPGTAGQSINYLIQATYQDQDTNAVVLPYYNASNPSQAYSGPNNSGATNNTLRKGAVVLSAKAGVAATTGSQVTPAPDAGYVGLAVVTVANGQTQITAPNITAYSGAPFINSTLLGLAPAFLISPTAPTPAQFDNSTKVATTAALRAFGIQASGITTVTATGTLTAAVAGGTVVINAASATTQTLPAASAFPAGARIEFLNINTGIGTIARAGTDTITVNNTTVTSLALGSGDTLTLESNGSNGWYAVAGSAQFGSAAAFGSSLGTSGYQKLPSGVIEQWGSVSSAAAGTAFSFTFPIAFPNACRAVTAIFATPGSTAYKVGLTALPTTTSASFVSDGASGQAVLVRAVGN